jgi:hypothetical protein
MDHVIFFCQHLHYTVSLMVKIKMFSWNIYDNHMLFFFEERGKKYTYIKRKRKN